MTATKYTGEYIRNQIENNDRWLERGILAIFDYQKKDEQNMDTTLYHNKVGFSGAHASFLSYCAKYIKSGRHLTGRFRDKARRFMMHYSDQLARIANGEQTV